MRVIALLETRTVLRVRSVVWPRLLKSWYRRLSVTAAYALCDLRRSSVILFFSFQTIFFPFVFVFVFCLFLCLSLKTFPCAHRPFSSGKTLLDNKIFFYTVSFWKSRITAAFPRFSYSRFPIFKKINFFTSFRNEMALENRYFL